jgi:RNA-directed DNA polymerase
MTETSSSTTISTKLERIAQLAREMPQAALTTLAHYIDFDWLREAYRRTRKDGATGVDRQTADEYARNLDDNLRSLLERAKTGSYVAPPVRRVHIPKAGDGAQTRPIGLPTFEDKVLQRAVTMVLEAVYEQSFLDCSYGFRPGRSAHQALRVVQSQTVKMAGKWILEVDIRNFFGTLDHSHLRDIVRKRVRDGVLLRLIGKWLNAGVMEDGVIEYPEAGTPQGGCVSPRTQKVTLNGWHTVRPTRSRRATAGRGRRRNRNAVADNDIIVAYQNLLDDQTHDPLALDHVERIGVVAQTSQERRSRLCQVQELGAIAGLINDRLQLGAQGSFALA